MTEQSDPLGVKGLPCPFTASKAVFLSVTSLWLLPPLTYSCASIMQCVNNTTRPTVVRLPASRTDVRGIITALPPHLLLDEVKDIILATIEPGHVRGNHFHEHKTELFTFPASAARWSLHWSPIGSVEGEDVRCERFEAESEVVVVVMPPGVPHAVSNDGDMMLLFTAMTDKVHDESKPDFVAHRLVEPGLPKL